MEKSSLHSAEVDFKLLFESVPGPFLVLNPQLTIIAVSDAYLLATKTKRAGIIGKYIFDVFTDNARKFATGAMNLKASLNKVLKTKMEDAMPVQKCNDLTRETDGTGFEEKYWSPVNSPVLDAGKEVAYIIHRIVDVTELMRLKERNREQGEKLLAMADERKVDAEIIEQKNKTLAYSNSELEAFSYSVSHDLRAPLRAIYGYTRILSDNYMGQLDEDAMEMLDKVVHNVKKMGNLIDGLLAFTRVGKKEILKTSINMTHVVQKTLIELKRSDFFQKTKFNISPLPPASGDYGMIGQVFTNLISNAIKYSHTREEPVVEIGSFQKDGSDIYYIKDNGVGFEMKYYNKLFGVFQRLHNANDFEGNGMGLALVKRIIAKHGGNVWAESEIGKGATFYFSLPR